MFHNILIPYSKLQYVCTIGSHGFYELKRNGLLPSFSFNVWYGDGPCLPLNSHLGLSEYYVTGMPYLGESWYSSHFEVFAFYDCFSSRLFVPQIIWFCIQCDTNVPTPPDIMLDSRDPKIRLFKLEWCKLEGTFLVCSKFRHMQVECLTVESWSLPRSSWKKCYCWWWGKLWNNWKNEVCLVRWKMLQRKIEANNLLFPLKI